MEEENVEQPDEKTLVDEVLAAVSEEERAELEKPVTKAEMLVVVSQLTADIEQLVVQVNQALGQVMNNQAVFDDRLQVLEDPSKPRIYLP